MQEYGIKKGLIKDKTMYNRCLFAYSKNTYIYWHDELRGNLDEG